jgi:hypothetical protein
MLKTLCGAWTHSADKRHNTTSRSEGAMTRSRIYRRLMLVLVLGNVIFWGWFWGYFFVHSNPAVSHAAVWEASPPWAVAFGRAFGNGTSLPEVLKIPTIRVATVVFVPCFVVTWPVSRWLPGGPLLCRR